MTDYLPWHSDRGRIERNSTDGASLMQLHAILYKYGPNTKGGLGTHGGDKSVVHEHVVQVSLI